LQFIGDFHPTGVTVYTATGQAEIWHGRVHDVFAVASRLGMG